MKPKVAQKNKMVHLVLSHDTGKVATPMAGACVLKVQDTSFLNSVTNLSMVPLFGRVEETQSATRKCP